MALPATDAADRAAMADLAPREFAFSRREFDRIAARLHDVAGIDMPPSKESLVYSRLAKRIRVLRLPSFAAYLDRLDDPGHNEIEHMLVALTTNVTRFYREPHHFEDMAQRSMPELAARARAGGRVRMWSAGCSSGQEPYSIALTVLETMPDAAARDVRILATDISMKVVEQAREGRYPREAISSVRPALRDLYFERDGDDHVVVTEPLRRLVAFRRLNLMEDWPFKGRFDAIFCRNVAIYFGDAVQSRLWARLSERLLPGGRLYIGHSERITGPAVTRLSTDGVTVYARNRGGA